MGARLAREHLERIYRRALEAVAPERLVARALSGELAGGEAVAAIVADARDIRILAAGKAALGMARALLIS